MLSSSPFSPPSSTEKYDTPNPNAQTTPARPNSPTATSRTAFLDECASGAFDGCLVAYRTFESVQTTGRLDAALVAVLPRSLRFVCHNGAGYDQIDIPACTARGIRVSNVRTAVDDATADAALFLMLGALRAFAPGIQTLRAGHWRGGPGTPADLPPQGRDPEGAVLGVLGMGGIGRALAHKARAAFGMRVLYHNRTRLSSDVEAECGAEYRGFEDLLRESDVLSLNLPLNVRVLPPFFKRPPARDISTNQPSVPNPS